MPPQGSIRFRLTVSTLLGCLIPFIIGFFVIKTMTERWLYDRSTETTRTILKHAADHVDGSVLLSMQQLAALIAEDPRLVDSPPDITTYMEPQSPSPAEVSTGEKHISSFFQSVVNTHDMISFVAFGTEYGGYVEYPPFSPSSSYDPRERPWYIRALNHEGPRISEPYETSVTRELVISFAHSIRKNNHPIGVLSMTISLDNIMTYISSMDIGHHGYIMILSPDGKVIHSPHHPEWLLQSIWDIDATLADKLNTVNGSFEIILDGTEKVLTHHLSNLSGWRYISVTDRREIMAQSRGLSELLILVFSVVSFVIVLLLYLISRRITWPIRRLSVIIKKMALFDFEGYEFRDLDRYTKTNDEIGEIATALNGMQLNFKELRSSLVDVDEKIQSIQVGDEPLRRMVLSEDNPFGSIAQSVNVLLEKVAGYVDRIDFLADHDPLTNLPNRRNFHRALSKSLSNGASGAVILLDMDNFKSINDTMGHVFGDRLLQQVAVTLANAMLPNTFVSRFGGDEFLILFEQKEQSPSLSTFIHNIRQLFLSPVRVDDAHIRVAFSMGISTYPKDSNRFEQILMNSDMALYDVKKRGKDNYAYFNSGMASHIRLRLETKALLQQALTEDGFILVYQPQIQLSDGKVTGYEALLRLKQHSISPAQFIPIAEEEGLIIPIGRLVAKLVVTQIAHWKSIGFNPPPVSINYSALQLADSAFGEYLIEQLDQCHVPPTSICLEITEHIFLENKTTATNFLTRMRHYGIRIAVDDFGSEYSSLGYLASLPIDILKFDREMNLRLLRNHGTDTMEKLIAFVHSLGLLVIAEGIEEEAHVKMLLQSKCDAIQGFYFSRPVAPEVIEAVGMNRFQLPS